MESAISDYRSETDNPEAGGRWLPVQLDQWNHFQVSLDLVDELDDIEMDLRAYAKREGLDFDALLDAASQQFPGQGHPLTPYAPSESEIEMIVEDERNAEFD